MRRRTNEQEWLFTAEGQPRGYVESGDLTELWFHTGTDCNLSCRFCFEGSKPSDNRIQPITPEDTKPFVEEAFGLSINKFAFTGGEPFVNPDFIAILDYALERRSCLVLTNGTEPLLNQVSDILKLSEKPNPLNFRISLDYPDPARHDRFRGKGNFHMALLTMSLLHEEGFGVSISRLMEQDEDTVAIDESYAEILQEAGLPEDLFIVKFPDFLRPGSITNSPEITEDCIKSNTTEAERAQHMCSFSRMVAKKNGRLGVYACTLVDDDEQFNLSDTLRERLGARIRLKHHRCYSCFSLGFKCGET